MSTERDQLAALQTRISQIPEEAVKAAAAALKRRLGNVLTGDDTEWEMGAYTVLAAAERHRKPRTITTVEELDALKLPAIINAQNGGPARVDYCYGPSRRKYVEYIFGEDDRDYSLESFAEFMGAATVLCEEA